MSRAGRPLLWVAGFVLVALLGAGVLAVTSDREVITPPVPTGSSSAEASTRADDAAALLLELTEAVAEGSRSQATRLAAPGEPTARRALRVIAGNAGEMGVSDLSMRFVDEEPGALSAAHRRDLGPGAWVGNVELSWRIQGYDLGMSTMEVPLTFVDTPDGVAFGAVAADSTSPAPLWLLTDLAVAKSRRALVAVADESKLRSYSELANQAVGEVRAVLPRWRGRLVVEVPASQEQLDSVLDARPNAYDSIAAVTATVDGSLSGSAPVHILVNPKVFGGLGEEGAQIVMSHEATHVAVDAATSTMPTWLLEGFADYVALARSDLPVSVTASQILAKVRQDGPPRSLPGADDFDPANKLLGTSYEAAWLACRLLAEEYGEKRLVAFYDAVDAGASTEHAFADLGTTEEAFTERWRGYLRELAG